jgi:ATPase subunit of ABC transporter with duplicated ATPase domains
MVPGARDIKVVNFSLSFHGENLIEDTTLELNYGRRYGLIGRNGSGKSTFLEALAFNDLELPPHIDKYLLSTEADPSDRTAMEEVSTLAITPTHTHTHHPPNSLTHHTRTRVHIHTPPAATSHARTHRLHTSPRQ